MTPNCIGFAVASMGVVTAGCKLTNINPIYTEPEMEHQINDSDAKVVIIDLFGDKVDNVVGYRCQTRHYSVAGRLLPWVEKGAVGFCPETRER